MSSAVCPTCARPSGCWASRRRRACRRCSTRSFPGSARSWTRAGCERGGARTMTTQAPAPELTVVLPVYNEPDNIGPTLRRLAAAMRTPAETLVVYDFDADATVPVVRALQEELPDVRLLRNDLGRGVLNAMKAGIAAARGEFVLITMADGSDEVELVEPMVALARDGADVVAASRYMKGGRQEGGPFLKRTLSRLAGPSPP